MADPRTCARCGHVHTGIPIQPTAHGLFFCTRCGTFALVKEMGEMVHRDDRADPDEWGDPGLGWH
jgi:hypothetical protein